MMGRIDKDNLDTSDGNSIELWLRRNPFIFQSAI